MKLTLTDQTDGCLSTRNVADDGCRLEVESENKISCSEEVWKDLILHQSFFDKDDCLKTKRWKPRLLLEEITAFDLEQLKNVTTDNKKSILASKELELNYDIKDLHILNLDNTKADEANGGKKFNEQHEDEFSFFDFDTKTITEHLSENYNLLSDCATHVERSCSELKQNKSEIKNNIFNEKEEKVKFERDLNNHTDQLKLVPYIKAPVNNKITSNISNVKLNFSLKNIEELAILPLLISQNFTKEQDSLKSASEKNKATRLEIRQNLVNEDLYDPEKFDQMPGPWPIDLPLPMPCWGRETNALLNFSTVIEYEEFASRVEMTEQRLLEETNYDTVDNFLQFSQEYRKMR